jgi:hypothetical protein
MLYLVAALVLVVSLSLGAVSRAADVSAVDFGAKGDGETDDTSAIQAALDKAGQVHGGVVQLPAGQFRLDGALTVPPGVTLQGVWKAPHYSSPEVGTTLLAYGGRGREDGPPLIMLETNSSVRGLTVYYPEQTVEDIQPYPWTIQGRGTHVNVSEVTLLNPYNGIDFGTYSHEMHYIRNVYGIPLHIGVRLDKCTDIGRVENVHFNPNSWTRSNTPTAPTGEAARKLVEHLQANATAFEIGRSDWEYMFNTFTWGCRIGYRFYRSDRGPTNGNFLGIAADWAVIPVLVEDAQQPGLLITNGEFVGSPACEAVIQVMPSNTGVLQLANCSFWGPHRKILEAAGRGTVSLSQCNFHQWGRGDAEATAVDVASGNAIIQACRFGQDKPHVRLGSDVTSAVVMGNLCCGGLQVANESDGDVQILGNAAMPGK